LIKIFLLAISDGQLLLAPFEVVNIDAHADLGLPFSIVDGIFMKYFIDRSQANSPNNLNITFRRTWETKPCKGFSPRTGSVRVAAL
jgi:hypothetical protein